MIEKIRDFMVKHYGTDPNWAEATAMSLVSTFAGRYYYITTNVAGNTFLNLMMIGIAPSRYGRKSVSMKLINEIFKQLGMMSFRLPSIKRSSVEGMCAMMNEQPYGLIWEDEVAASFADLNYKKGMDEFMSQLYDGNIDGRRTKSGGYEPAKDVYLNFLGAGSVVFFKKVSDQMFEQGLGNRILWMRWGDIQFSYETADMKNFYDELAPITEYFAELLPPLKEYMSPSIEIEYDEFAINKIISQSRDYDIKGMALDEYDYLRGVYAEAQLYLRKISAIRALSKNRRVVVLEDVEWSIQKLDYFITQFQNVLIEWNTVKGMQPAKNDKTLIDTAMINARILSEGSDHFSHKSLLEHMNMQTRDFQSLVDTLLETNKIVQLTAEQKNAIPRDKRNGWMRNSAYVYSLDIKKYANDGVKNNDYNKIIKDLV